MKYPKTMTTEAKKLFQKIDSIQKRTNALRPLRTDLLQTLQEKLRIEWTYNSNAIEGNTLTFGETAFFLREGLTSEGRPLKDYLEAKNHAEAIDGLAEIIRGDRSITESLIKELHAVLTGKIHYYADPIHVKDEMEKLLNWHHAEKKLHIIEKAALFHYRFVTIHPFDDGNGRLSRLLMNLILMQSGYPPCIIRNSRRRQYLQALESVDSSKNHATPIIFVAEELLQTQENIINILENKSEVEFKTKIPHSISNREEREISILEILKNKPQSIGQILEKNPEAKRPTLKTDLQRLIKLKKIRKNGTGKGVIYSL